MEKQVHFHDPYTDVQNLNLNMIIEGLYLGNAFAARNEALLKARNITHILSVTPLAAHYPPSDPIVRKIVAVDDYADEDLMSHFADTNAYIADALTKGGVLVHCQQGVSRSATVVAAYLMTTQSISATEAIQFIKARRPIANPNVGFREQLELYGAAGCDMGSEEGQKAHQAWQRERDATYAMKVKQTLGADQGWTDVRR